MDNLSRIIGPAPSEMSFEELQKKLSEERSRVTKAIESTRFTTPKPKRASTKPKSKRVTAKALQQLLDGTGISLEELEKELKKNA